MSDKLRVWTLTVGMHNLFPGLGEDENVRVVEAEPLINLLRQIVEDDPVDLVEIVSDARSILHQLQEQDG